MIKLEQVNFSYDVGSELLKNINMQVNDGEYVAIVGENGSGKSTLAACINGLNPYANPGEAAGTLTVDGVDAMHSTSPVL